MVTDPAAYRHCHLFPESYEVIRDRTPRSLWIPQKDLGDINRVLDVAASFGPRPVIVKDYVKSRKHDWAQACFIRSGSDRSNTRSIVERFMELQGPDLVGGLVFREFIELESIGIHPTSGMPLSCEYRIFWLDGSPMTASEYWASEGDYTDAPLPIQEFTALAGKIRSRFFTMDIARAKSGQWIILELGDGQVAGLPTDDIAPDFYARLYSGLAEKHRPRT